MTALRPAASVLDLLLARGGDEHVQFAVDVVGFADDLKIEIDFVEGEWNVLVGLGLDLHLHLLLAQTVRQKNLLGDDGGGRQRHRNLLDARTHATQCALERLGHRFEIYDVSVRDGVAWQGLDRITFDADSFFHPAG